jgi:DNA-binding transcriptional regulator YdaS (Cro superfamily)
LLTDNVRGGHDGHRSRISRPANSADDALREAIDKAGGAEALCKKMSIGAHLPSRWIASGNGAPPSLCHSLEAITGVRCEVLQPDLLWIRDGAGEVLGFLTPVDGADAAYVRQAMAMAPKPKPNFYQIGESTVVAGGEVEVSHEAIDLANRP